MENKRFRTIAFIVSLIISFLTIVTSLCALSKRNTKDSSSVNYEKILVELELIRQIEDSPVSVAYILNSECSVCIADCISLLKELSRHNSSAIVSIYIQEWNKDLVDFYFNLSGIDHYDNFEIVPVEYQYPYSELNLIAQSVLILPK